MESVNLAETHRTEDISKAKSNGARVPGCPCDNRGFIHTNLFGPFYPPVPRSRTCQEISPDLIFRQPCFFYPHFTQPFIQDNSASQNYCCVHDHLKNQTSKPNTKDKVVHVCGQIRRQATPQMFCQMKKNPARDKNGVENESHELPEFPKDTREPKWNNQPCECGESLPWTSSPFILPVISYCVMWNRQNDNCFHSPCDQIVNVNQTNLGGDDANAESKAKCDKNSESESVTGNCSDDDDSKKETEKLPSRSCASSVALNSSTEDDCKMYLKEKSSSSSTKAGSDIHSEEEAAEELQVRFSGLSNNSQNNSSTKSSEKILSSNGDCCIIFSAENQSEHSSAAGSQHDIKAEGSSTDHEEVDDEIKCVSVTSEENNICISPKTSNESIEEKDMEEVKVMEVEPCDVNPAAASKECIKNFKMTSPTEETLPENSGAGGDLGGNACTGFKMRIESEETQFENIPQATENQNSQLKTISLKGVEEKKPSKSSGIARLIHPNTSRDAKSIKRDSDDLGFINMKRKRCQTDSQIREATFKILKVTTPKINQKDRGGSENQSAATITNGRFLKKTGKSPVPKVRPHNCNFNSKK